MLKRGNMMKTLILSFIFAIGIFSTQAAHSYANYDAIYSELDMNGLVAADSGGRPFCQICVTNLAICEADCRQWGPPAPACLTACTHDYAECVVNFCY